MTFNEMIGIVDELSPTELRQLREYIDERETQIQLEQVMSPAERAQRLVEAFAELRSGLSKAELAEITEAMNEEYVEIFDESEWRD